MVIINDLWNRVERWMGDVQLDMEMRGCMGETETVIVAQVSFKIISTLS